MISRVASAARQSSRRSCNAILRRNYAEESGGGGSKPLGKREKAQEDQYVRQKEQEKLKKLKQQLADAKATMEELEKEVKKKDSK